MQARLHVVNGDAREVDGLEGGSLPGSSPSRAKVTVTYGKKGKGKEKEKGRDRVREPARPRAKVDSREHETFSVEVDVPRGGAKAVHFMALENAQGNGGSIAAAASANVLEAEGQEQLSEDDGDSEDERGEEDERDDEDLPHVTDAVIAELDDDKDSKSFQTVTSAFISRARRSSGSDRAMVPSRGGRNGR